MNEPPATITRRGVLRALAGGGITIAAAAIAGCGTGQPPQPTGNIVMLIRNGEQSGGSSLSTAGQVRARALADVFSPEHKLPRAGLDRPRAVYACAPADERAGVVDTVTPLAQRLHLQVITDLDGQQPDAVVRRVTTQPGPSVICAGNDEIPKITHAFDPVNASPPDTWPPTRFDVIWVLTQTTDGWVFSQLPQQVLPGDQASEI